MTEPIDINFDFRTETPKDGDPDRHSGTLREYHKLLWSKPLPVGGSLHIKNSRYKGEMHHNSEVGEFYFSSDTANSSYKQVRRLADIRDKIPTEDLSRFRTIIYSIGNMIIFPSRMIEGEWTINQERGCNRQIGDRFDLTLECIRLHYLNQWSPLADALQRYKTFFSLFSDFKGYVGYFLLQDLVSDDYSKVGFLLPFSDFDSRSPYPETIDSFITYIEAATQFIQSRNKRILSYCECLHGNS